MKEGKTKQKKFRILFVDDEEAILASARRLFRNNRFEILTAPSPTKALEILRDEICHVVVSDYKMPEMNGIDFLKKIKNDYPHITRMMLTGFLELHIVQDAINRAAVFRFITKPWDEPDLLQGIEAAIHHSQRARFNISLLKDITKQNEKLEGLTFSLESKVIERTRLIEEQEKSTAQKERRSLDLTEVIHRFSTAQNILELFELFTYEVRRQRGYSTPCYFVVEHLGKKELFWQKGILLRSQYVSTWPPEDAQGKIAWFEKTLVKEMGTLISVPILDGEKSKASFYIEIQSEKENTQELQENLKNRREPLAILIDCLLLQRQLYSATQEWEETFNSLRDPIAIFDNQNHVIRSNTRYLERHEESCKIQEYPIKTSHDNTPLRIVRHYRNTSHEKELFLKLVQSEKLAAVGLLAGNIAHELNNPLSGIRAMAQYWISNKQIQHSHIQDFAEIEKAALRCQQIIKNLLNFSKIKNDEVQSFDLNDLIKATLPLLKSTLRMQRFEFHAGSQLPAVNGQPNLIQQVIFNLINNASQAMPQGGRITVKTWSETGKVCFAVSDSGPGIPKNIQPQIFEPFFTTKNVGVGTGLGLSVSRSIINLHRGDLKLESSELGATFTVTLPK